MTPDTNVPVLRTESLHSGYGHVKILHDVEVEVAPHSIVSAIGPNGAGKSTLLKTVYGLVRPTEGRVLVTVDGSEVDITGWRPDQITRIGLNYVPQINNVFPLMTVMENLEVGGVLAPQVRTEQLAKVFELFPVLAQKRNQRAETLSGGQRQMVAFGRALMSDPWLILLDEPSAGLAPMVVEEVFDNLTKINEAGIALLVVEQNARQILAKSHYAYVLEMGRNRFEGTGPELLDDDKLAELYLGGQARATGEWAAARRGAESSTG